MSNATPGRPGEPQINTVDLLLILHDGDDRCGCLRRSLALALNAAAWGSGDVDADVVGILAACLASHPAGDIARGMGFPSSDDGDGAA